MFIVLLALFKKRCPIVELVSRLITHGPLLANIRSPSSLSFHASKQLKLNLLLKFINIPLDCIILSFIPSIFIDVFCVGMN